MPSSTSLAKILVVAPNADLRQSLAFMLTAEGFEVETRTGWRAGDQIGPNLVVVMDHGSLAKGFRDDGVLKNIGARLILLTSVPESMAGLVKASLVRKPLLDQTLLNALQSVLSTSST